MPQLKTEKQFNTYHGYCFAENNIHDMILKFGLQYTLDYARKWNPEGRTDEFTDGMKTAYNEFLFRHMDSVE